MSDNRCALFSRHDFKNEIFYYFLPFFHEKRHLIGEKISQFELNLYSDYLYSSRDFSNKKGENFAKYLFNNIKQQDNYKTTPCIIGAISSYFTQEYQLDEEVKNSRFFVANYDFAKKVTLAHSSGKIQ